LIEVASPSRELDRSNLGSNGFNALTCEGGAKRRPSDRDIRRRNCIEAKKAKNFFPTWAIRRSELRLREESNSSERIGRKPLSVLGTESASAGSQVGRVAEVGRTYPGIFLKWKRPSWKEAHVSLTRTRVERKRSGAQRSHVLVKEDKRTRTRVWKHTRGPYTMEGVLNRCSLGPLRGSRDAVLAR